MSRTTARASSPTRSRRARSGSSVNPTTGAITKTNVGFQPCFGGPGTNGGQGAACGTVAAPNPLLVNEGHDSTMEFSEGNYGLLQGALEYSQDVTPPQTTIEYSAAQTAGDPINFRFDWVDEPSVIYYTTDGSTPTVVDCENPTGSTRCYRNQGPRRPGEVLTLSALGAHTIKWMSVDIKGNQEAVQSQRLLVAADDADGHGRRHGAGDAALSLGAPASFGPFTPGIDFDYSASMTANVISTAGDATAVGGRSELDQHGQAGQRHVRAGAAAAGLGVEPVRDRRGVRSGRWLGQPDVAAHVRRPDQQRPGHA